SDEATTGNDGLRFAGTPCASPRAVSGRVGDQMISMVAVLLGDTRELPVGRRSRPTVTSHVQYRLSRVPRSPRPRPMTRSGAMTIAPPSASQTGTAVTALGRRFAAAFVGADRDDSATVAESTRYRRIAFG